MNFYASTQIEGLSDTMLAGITDEQRILETLRMLHDRTLLADTVGRTDIRMLLRLAGMGFVAIHTTITPAAIKYMQDRETQ